MRLMVMDVDHSPPELAEQAPFTLQLLRQLPGPDRSDYWLGVLDRPLRWIDGGEERSVTHLLVAARWAGTRIEPLVRNLPVNIAYVTDMTQLDDDRVDFQKSRYVAIGTAEWSEEGSRP